MQSYQEIAAEVVSDIIEEVKSGEWGDRVEDYTLEEEVRERVNCMSFAIYHESALELITFNESYFEGVSEELITHYGADVVKSLFNFIIVVAVEGVSMEAESIIRQRWAEVEAYNDRDRELEELAAAVAAVL
jgi:hypothetical protein